MTKSFSKLTPPEVLALAVAIESSNARRYEEWAHRLLPFDPEAAHFMNELVEEEKKHEAQLAELYHQKYKDLTIHISPQDIEENIENPQELENHFFVVNNQMANSILKAALENENRARAFYTNALQCTEDKTLRSIYEILSSFEEEHVQRIEKKINQFNSSSEGKS